MRKVEITQLYLTRYCIVQIYHKMPINIITVLIPNQYDKNDDNERVKQQAYNIFMSETYGDLAQNHAMYICVLVVFYAAY